MSTAGICRWIVCAAVGAALTVTSPYAAELPDGFRLEPVLPSGLTEPSALAVAADGTILIAERTTGRVRVLTGGELRTDPVCTVAVSATGESGLLGIALHPAFRSGKPWMYLYYTDAGGSHRVTRYVMSGPTCAAPFDIVTGLGPSSLRNGGGLAFGPDDTLYVATGDFGSPSNGQNGAVPASKILRFNDDGTIPADNPTPGSATYATGVQNGRGLAVAPSGQVYLADAGDDAGSIRDELNAVRPGANLGWNSATGSSGGVYDDPLAEWLPVIGVHGLARYGATAFPNVAADGLDNDADRFGADRAPGVARTNDDTNGECIGSANYGQPCTSAANCPRRTQSIGPLQFSEVTACELRDELDEYCPGGVVKGDDACGANGARGIDEPDEAFNANLFMAASDGNRIVRAVLDPADPQALSTQRTFLDSTSLADCPDGWTGVATGNDGFLYAVAVNGGGASGGLYRIVYDDAPGPREVSAPGSHFPLTVGRGASAGDVVLSWEDLRTDAMQPRDDGTNPLRPVREYTVWQGTIGSWTSHAVVPGFDGIQGTEVNGALRRATVPAGSGSSYFLVSARGANLQGSLGNNSAGTARTGFANADLCTTLGYHQSPSYDLWKCGQDFQLRDERGELHSLYEFRGQPIVLDLSAIWCPPCIVEADTLENMNQQYRDRGVRFLTVLADEDDQLLNWSGRPTPAECRNWGDRGGTNPDHTFPCWVDPVGGAQQAWPKFNKFSAFPTNVVLDAGLRVVYSGAGYNEPAIRATLDALVGTGDTCLP